jgi:hypothetical protein
MRARLTPSASAAPLLRSVVLSSTKGNASQRRAGEGLAPGPRSKAVLMNPRDRGSRAHHGGLKSPCKSAISGQSTARTITRGSASQSGNPGSNPGSGASRKALQMAGRRKWRRIYRPVDCSHFCSQAPPRSDLLHVLLGERAGRGWRFSSMAVSSVPRRGTSEIAGRLRNGDHPSAILLSPVF